MRLEAPSTSLTLIEGVRRDDRDAKERLYRLYCPIVYDWARHLGLDPADAEDVTQQAFVRIFQAFPRFRRELPHEKFRKWTYTIVRRLAIDLNRRRQRHQLPLGGTEGGWLFENLADPNLSLSHVTWGNSAPPMDKAERARLVQSALNDLKQRFSEKRLAAFWMRIVEDRPASEVGEQLSMTPEAVRKATHDILTAIRTMLHGVTATPLAT